MRQLSIVALTDTGEADSPMTCTTGRSASTNTVSVTFFVALAGRDLAAAVAEAEFLLERRAGGKRIGRERHAHLADLQQARHFAERIGAGDVEEQVAVLLRPRG